MCGYSQNVMYEVYHSLNELRGEGFLPIRESAGSGYILHLLKNWHTPTEDAGKFFRIVVTWSQYKSGTSFSVFTANKDKPRSYIW